MKKIVYIALLVLATSMVAVSSVSAADKAALTEYAIVLWDGSDRLIYNLPDKFEVVHVAKTGITLPKEAHEEEFYLMIASNVMAKDGWEPVDLNSRRILYRRATVDANGAKIVR